MDINDLPISEDKKTKNEKRFTWWHTDRYAENFIKFYENDKD